MSVWKTMHGSLFLGYAYPFDFAVALVCLCLPLFCLCSFPHIWVKELNKVIAEQVKLVVVVMTMVSSTPIVHLPRNTDFCWSLIASLLTAFCFRESPMSQQRAQQSGHCWWFLPVFDNIFADSCHPLTTVNHLPINQSGQNMTSHLNDDTAVQNHELSFKKYQLCSNNRNCIATHPVCTR